MDLEDGTELLIERISGSTNYVSDALEGQIFDRIEQKTIRGKYMSVTLGRLFVNVPLYYQLNDEVRCFTMLEATWQNIWDYRMNTNLSGIKMIDTDGFQHSGSNGVVGFDQIYKPDSDALFKVKFATAEYILEPYAKTKGWVWFEPLPQGVLPRRFVFIYSIFDPGHLSGWVRDTETLNFSIEAFDRTEIRHLP